MSNNPYLPGVIAIPSFLLIIAATKAYPMVITVEIAETSTEANTYIPGMAVRLRVPRPYGMWQADGQIAEILGISGSEFSLKLDSSQFDTFVVPGGSKVQAPATIAPAGSRNLTYSNATSQVPFQSLNNIGN